MASAGGYAGRGKGGDLSGGKAKKKAQGKKRCGSKGGRVSQGWIWRFKSLQFIFRTESLSTAKHYMLNKDLDLAELCPIFSSKILFLSTDRQRL